MKQKLPILFFFFLWIIFRSDHLFAADIENRGNIAIFTQSHNDIQLSAVVDDSLKRIISVLNDMGRFYPVDRKYSDSELKESDNSDKDPYRAAAERLGVEAYIIVDCFRRSDVVYTELTFTALSERYKSRSRKILVRSRIPVNLPVKAAIEVAKLHEKIPLYADIMFAGSGIYLVKAGQWHGLKAGKYRIDENEEMELVQPGRFFSYARITSRFIGRKSITIYKYPDVKSAIEKLEKISEENTIYRYGIGSTLIKGSDPEKRFVESTCIINPGANICLPGYGAFLATGYMGFQRENPSMIGVSVSALLLITHFTLTEFLTDFNTAFFPWDKDPSRSSGMTRLQYFLWMTVPLTMTAAYFDQLAWQYSRSGNLPPFFNTRNEAAAAFSLLFPGCGLFYKGYRATGWFFYFAEMSLAGYASYHYSDPGKFKYSMYGFALVKAVDIIAAYFIQPSFETYNFEKEGDVIRILPKISYDFPTKDTTYGFEVSLSF